MKAAIIIENVWLQQHKLTNTNADGWRAKKRERDRRERDQANIHLLNNLWAIKSPARHLLLS